ncbi:Growth arrest-specific 2-like [Mycena sanguinolenta]|uniref:Growth arrest-specific 2-like n=1 Tax=Mycena sanguinolenta TaxID=230812 RepID=A0A8H7D0L9_9AGAR|nr:Growth arrest-specific 2-like [Mycena sanguinolenta]
METPASEPPSPLPTRELTSQGGNNVAVSTRRGSAIGHLAILSTGLAAIAFIPYLVTRRQVSTLRRRIDEMGATTALLKQRQSLGQVAPGVEPEVTTAGLLAEMRQEMAAMREQLEQKDSERTKTLSDMTMDAILINEQLDELRGDVSKAVDGSSWAGSRLELLQSGLHALRKETESLRKETEAYRGEVQEQLRQLRVEQDSLRSALFKLSDEVQSSRTPPHSSELQQLLQETRRTRAVVFGDIGTALGDIAYVIQRLDVEMGHEFRHGGYDPVERIRVLALRMQDEGLNK